MAKWQDMYLGRGFKTLLTDGDNNPKTAKSNKAGNYFTVIIEICILLSGGIAIIKVLEGRIGEPGLLSSSELK